jgi:hypothetical protein
VSLLATATVNTIQSDDQFPRYRDDPYGGHFDVFKVDNAAVLLEAVLKDIAPAYANVVSPGDIGQETKLHIRKVAGTRKKTDDMQPNEKASMQVRNGSGLVQPFLSAASVQSDSKRIRANKGERFDTGAENQATLEIDMSLLDRAGVMIINQHAEESNVFKIAYDRYTDTGDVKAMERTLYRWIVKKLSTEQGREELATLIKVEKAKIPDNTSSGSVMNVAAMLVGVEGLLPEAVGLNKDAFKSMNETERRAVLSLTGDTLKPEHLSIKRTAAQELDEYIYSARKNREVLVSRIPLQCVVLMRLNNEKDMGKWPGLTMDKYPKLKAAYDSGAWVRFSEIQTELTEYLTADDNANLKAMWKAAAIAKQRESGRT